MAKVALAAERVPVATTKAAGRQDRTKAYDSWGCPDATRGTRGVLGSPSCCSRTSTLSKRAFILLFDFSVVIMSCYVKADKQ